MFQNNYFQAAGLSQVDLYVHETSSRIERAGATQMFEGVHCTLPQTENEANKPVSLFHTLNQALNAVAAQLTRRSTIQQH